MGERLICNIALWEPEDILNKRYRYKNNPLVLDAGWRSNLY